MSDALSFIGSLILQLFTFVTPWGIAFGSVIVGIFGLPLLVKVLRKIF